MQRGLMLLNNIAVIRIRTIWQSEMENNMAQPPTTPIANVIK